MNSKEYDQKEDLNPLHRQISGQNSSGSMCQNSTVENSTASSGYGTASKINVHCICAFCLECCPHCQWLSVLKLLRLFKVNSTCNLNNKINMVGWLDSKKLRTSDFYELTLIFTNTLSIQIPRSRADLPFVQLWYWSLSRLFKIVIISLCENYHVANIANCVIHLFYENNKCIFFKHNNVAFMKIINAFF